MSLFCYFMVYAITIISVMGSAFIAFKAGEKDLILKYGKGDKK